MSRYLINSMPNSRKCILVLTFLSVWLGSCGQSLVGKIVAVKDGDSMEMLLDSNKLIRVRLAGIDCPEHSQAWGLKAKKYTSDLCFGKTVAATVTDTDRYGRSIAIILLPDHSILNEKLVEAGYAWHYVRYSSDKRLATLEKEARAKHLGLWADKESIAPWEYRKSHGNSYSQTK